MSLSGIHGACSLQLHPYHAGQAGCSGTADMAGYSDVISRGMHPLFLDCVCCVMSLMIEHIASQVDWVHCRLQSCRHQSCSQHPPAMATTTMSIAISSIAMNTATSMRMTMQSMRTRMGMLMSMTMERTIMRHSRMYMRTSTMTASSHLPSASPACWTLAG